MSAQSAPCDGLPSTVVLLVPTVPESRAVSAGLRGSPAGSTGRRPWVIGIGPECARAVCGRLDALEPPPRAVVLLGWAGGLSPDLPAGAVVVADAALDDTGRRVPCTAVPVAGARVGPMLTVPAVLASPSAKAAAARSGAIAVEMEAFPIAAWADSLGVPFVHARVVLDAADDPLPDLEGSLHPDGRVRRAALGRHLARHPVSVLALARVAWRMRALAPALGGLASQIERGLPSVLAAADRTGG